MLMTYIIKEIIEHIRLKFNCGVEKIFNIMYGVISIFTNIMMQK